MQEGNQKTIVIATVSFIVGFALAWLISSGKTTSSIKSDGNSDEGPNVQVEGLLAGPNAIAVIDQAPGAKVAVATVVLEKGGWVVIHEEDNGMPGKILGAQLFDPGTWTDGAVDLLRGTVEGSDYYAMLHSDNGDRAFDPKKDLPIVGADTSPIMMKFKATATAEPSADVQM